MPSNISVIASVSARKMDSVVFDTAYARILSPGPLITTIQRNKKLDPNVLWITLALKVFLSLVYRGGNVGIHSFRFQVLHNSVVKVLQLRRSIAFVERYLELELH